MDPCKTNPKDLIGIKKPQLWLIPGPALIHLAMVMKNGADKYGAYNWRDKAVRATVYVDAALRHLHSFLDGEDDASDSGRPHLAHAAACCAILLDAIETGNLIDDRPTKAPTGDLIERLKIKDEKEVTLDDTHTHSILDELYRQRQSRYSTPTSEALGGTDYYNGDSCPKEGRTGSSDKS